MYFTIGLILWLLFSAAIIVNVGSHSTEEEDDKWKRIVIVKKGTKKE